MPGSTDIAAFVAARHPATGAPSPVGAEFRFSIVMPAYQHGAFIERSLLSVLNQNHPGTELIVIDGGSTDATRGVLERYAAELAHVVSEPDRGQSDALNKGFARARGEILGWLNSDDIYLPGAFAAAARVFATRPEVEVVYGDWYTIDVGDRVAQHYPALEFSLGRHITEGVFCNAQSMFWRRSFHARLAAFDVDLHYTMDYDLILQMILAGGGRGAFYRLPEPLGCFRVYPGQKTGSNDARVAAEHRRIAERAGVSWKYRLPGRALRLYYRASRVAQYLARGRGDFVRASLGARFGGAAAR